jgi:hypothetical protein
MTSIYLAARFSKRFACQGYRAEILRAINGAGQVVA